MINLISNQDLCEHCGFIPFCQTAENDCQQHNLLQGIVRVRRELKRNDILCLPKYKFESLYAIQSGALKAYQIEMNGKEIIHGFYFTGEIVGYKAIHKGHYLSTIVALADTVVCEIPYDHLLRLLESHPDLQKHILQLISRQLNIGSYLDCTGAEQRIAAFLIDMRGRLQQGKHAKELLLPMTRQDIGNHLKLTAETVSRVFSKWQRDNIITIDGKSISFDQWDRLKVLAG